MRRGTGIAYMEHRCGTRVALCARAIVTATSRDSAVACVTDASVTGAFVETSLKPALLSRVMLRVPAAPSAALMLEGFVVRHEDRGIAVEWLDPGSEDALALTSLGEAQQSMQRAFAPSMPAVQQELAHAAELQAIRSQVG
jgi:hypothetical protein